MEKAVPYGTAEKIYSYRNTQVLKVAIIRFLKES